MSKSLIKEHSILKVDGSTTHANRASEKHNVVQYVDTKDKCPLKDQENKLKLEFQEILSKEIEKLKEDFELVLQNEQFRTAFMLRQAQREKDERISSLQAQMECKNMAGLMYVLCMERKQNQLEQLRIIEAYTTYIEYLLKILNDGQQLILYLSREYKSAARVDQEWREKMRSFLHEFQRFIRDYSGGTTESIQHLFDLSALMKVEASKKQDPNEDPCDEEPPVIEAPEPEPEKLWYEKMDCGPFVVFGDMGDFDRQIRREVLRKVKAKKTAPRKWSEYIFNNDMPLKRKCEHADDIKFKFPKTGSHVFKLDSQGVQTGTSSVSPSHQNLNHRCTSTSVDLRLGTNQMGSIIKLMTATPYKFSENKTLLLGARDSMEIASSTRLLKIKKHSGSSSRQNQDKPAAVAYTESTNEVPLNTIKLKGDDEEDTPVIGSQIRDSIQLINQRIPDKDATITEKICPVEKCRNLKMDSFIKSLPAYMRSGPYYHFEQTFEEYEVLSPEQLNIVKERLENSAKEEKPCKIKPCEDWATPAEGVSCQTSFEKWPECKCLLKKEPIISEEPSEIIKYYIKDLRPVKKMIDHIKEECLFDETIQFDRFKVVGEACCTCNMKPNKKEFKDRFSDVKDILTKHPSICSLFQANT